MTSRFEREALEFRRDQADIAARAALKVGQYWKGVTPGNEWSEMGFVDLATPILTDAFQRAVDAARDFTYDQVGVLPETILPNQEQMAASMAYVGPIEARRILGRVDEWTAEVTAQAREARLDPVRGSAVRLVAEGGRKAVKSATGARVGWMRITGPDPCYFCIALASRGPVYEHDSFDQSDPRFTGPGSVKVHDSCKCAFVPLTPDEEGGIQQLRRHREMWNDLAYKNQKSTDGSPMVTFRRNYSQLYGWT